MIVRIKKQKRNIGRYPGLYMYKHRKGEANASGGTSSIRKIPPSRAGSVNRRSQKVRESNSLRNAKTANGVEAVLKTTVANLLPQSQEHKRASFCKTNT